MRDQPLLSVSSASSFQPATLSHFSRASCPRPLAWMIALALSTSFSTPAHASDTPPLSPKVSPPILLAQAEKGKTPTRQSLIRARKALTKPAIPVPEALPAPASNSFRVTDIQVRGLSDIEPSTVYTYLPIKIGDTITPDTVQSAIQNLYGTRLFDDVAIARQTTKDGEVLVVTVKEREVIGELAIEGTYEFEPDKMKESLRGAGLSEGKLMDPVLLLLAEQELKRQYVARGYYGVKVRREVTPLDKRRVKVSLIVEEGKVALIDRITIFGNQDISDSTLRGLMDSTDSAFFNSSKRYSREKLDADLDRIRAFYLTEGYLDFQLDTAQVSISPDLSKIYINIGVREGVPYRVRGIELANPSEWLDEKSFNDFNTIKVDSRYNQDTVNLLNKNIYEHLAQQGFAQARADVQKIKSSEPEDHSVLLRVAAITGPRMTVRNINISGNTRTSDEVIRREFRLYEGNLFDSTLVDKSRQRIERTNFFSDVAMDIAPTNEAVDQVDINAKVTEKRTGNIQFGITSNSTSKVGFNASIQQNNWLGSGKALNLSFNTATSSRSLNASYYDPYITNWGLGMGLSAYQTLDDSSTLSTGAYKVTSQGAGLRFNYPLSDDSALGFSLRAGRDKYTIFSNSPATYVDFTNTYGLTPTDITWSTSFSVDKRDSTIYPTRGAYFNASNERALPASILQYQRTLASFQYYVPITERVAVLFNTDVGKVTPLKGLTIPFSKYLYAGGIGSVRGYEYGTLGPYDASTSRYTGGDRFFNANFELLLPFPGSKRSREARFALFYDTGMAWGPGEAIGDRKLRSSYGLALSWTSPIGPLRFSYAEPINKQVGDKLERFQFQVGTAF